MAGIAGAGVAVKNAFKKFNDVSVPLTTVAKGDIGVLALLKLVATLFAGTALKVSRRISRPPAAKAVPTGLATVKPTRPAPISDTLTLTEAPEPFPGAENR